MLLTFFETLEFEKNIKPSYVTVESGL